MSEYFNLKDNVALVTGASSGIGSATADVLADLGAKVAIGYHGNASGAEATRQRIVERGGTAVTLRADVRRTEEVRALVDRATEALGPIDILVNNAGSLVQRVAMRDVSEQLWDEIMTLNLKSAALCSQAVAASMIARKKGAIINVGSIAGRHGGGPGAGPYAAAKAGLMSLTKSMAREWAPHGIRVNAIAPGVIDTPFHEAFSTPELLRTFINSIPLGRLGTPLECATVIAFLATSAASFLVGETIEVNGGQLML